MAKRRVVVLGTGRSGTSLVAGLCHKLGCSMGTHFTPSNATNPSGTYEEVNLFNLNRREPPGTPADYSRYVKDRDTRQGNFWGIKDPGLIGLMKIDDIMPFLMDGVVFVLVERDRLPSIQSFQQAYGSTKQEAKEWHKILQNNLNKFLASLGGKFPILRLKYDDILADPVGLVTKLASFLYAGSSAIEDVKIATALEHIDPSLRHYDSDGHWIVRETPIKRGDWGSVAVGARIHRHPEITWVIDWTALVMHGLRKGDTVLIPRGAMPAHWAGDAMVRDFLRTDKDSLLMIDDDMSFPVDSLEAMRKNEKNWEYDICFGFCTMRAWPPRPVMMRRIMDRTLPASLLGDAFERIMSFEDGEVVPVDAVGLAFTLIRRHVFEAMLDRSWGPEWTMWFKSLTRAGLLRESYGRVHDPEMNEAIDVTNFFSYGEGKESDDIPFSRMVREHGFRMCVDTSIKIGHVGHAPLGYADFRRWQQEEAEKKRSRVDFNSDDLLPTLTKAADLLEGEDLEKAERLIAAIESAS